MCYKVQQLLALTVVTRACLPTYMSSSFKGMCLSLLLLSMVCPSIAAACLPTERKGITITLSGSLSLIMGWSVPFDLSLRCTHAFQKSEFRWSKVIIQFSLSSCKCTDWLHLALQLTVCNSFRFIDHSNSTRIFAYSFGSSEKVALAEKQSFSQRSYSRGNLFHNLLLTADIWATGIQVLFTRW